MVSSALGGGKKAKPRIPQSGVEAEAMFNGVFGIKSNPGELSSMKDPFSGLEETFKKIENVKAP